MNLFNYFESVLRSRLPEQLSEHSIDLTIIISSMIACTLLMLIARYVINKLMNENLIQKISLNRSRSISRNRTINSILRNLFMYSLYFIYAYTILDLLGLPVRTLVAGAGIAGVAIGLGAKDLISSFITGFFILFENQMEIGDLVVINQEIMGTVTKIGIRTSTIRTATGDNYYIENSEISIINNMSRSIRQINIDLPVSDLNDLSAFESVIHQTTEEICQNYNSVITDEPTYIGLVRGEGQSFNYRISIRVQVGEDYVHSGIFYREYFRALQAHQYHIPYSIYDTIPATDI